MNKNDYDIHLLLKDPNRFIEEHQKTIFFVVNKFVYTGLINYQDRDEVVQYINEKLLTDKIGKMQSQYRPTYFVVTYLSKIVHNLCLEYSRKQRTPKRIEDYSIDISKIDVADSENASRQVLIDEESKRLDAILNMYHRHRHRIEVLLKVLFGIGICREDLLRLYSNANEKDIDRVAHACNPVSDKDKKTDKQLYETMTAFLNKYERKQNTPDALRKWTNAKITEIVNLLNGKPQTANYDKETLKILFQFTYKNFHFRESK